MRVIFVYNPRVLLTVEDSRAKEKTYFVLDDFCETNKIVVQC
jgi:hypothetical protein